ncbi:hypothetical protein GGQ74_000155 [Desulfobaculum xiamenense]|uniref:Uncharacterized protein n=1 Tax=Desulfobaculum xiamenense TaxID=995050 RepID=A0A846QM56_9BACT|nr:hypothetical protein [Desulfobaculum xiamenense]NJB66515.1 hypothetical protein [Desulfobaculum xiamenense]
MVVVKGEGVREAYRAEIVAVIARWLCEGHGLGTEGVRYAERTLGDCDGATLAGVLAEPEHPEHAPLAELLVYPDNALCNALEPLLCRVEPGAEDVAPLAADLLAAAPSPVVTCGDGQRLHVPFDVAAARLLVKRLHIDRTAPSVVRAAIRERFGEGEDAVELLVTLRHARLAWHEPHAAFVADVVALVEGDVRRMGDALRWTAAFLEDVPPDGDLAGALATRYERARGALTRSDRFRDTLARSNYETMVMRGMREPHFEPEALRRDMELANALSLAVFGMPAAVDAMFPETDLGSFEGESGLRRLIGLMEE